MDFPTIRDIFPNRLKALREAIGVSQEAFAKALNVSRAAIGYYENGSRLPDIEFLYNVNDKTGCSIAFLMGHSDTMNASYADLAYEGQLGDDEVESFLKLSRSGSFIYFLSNENTERLFYLFDKMIFEDWRDPFVRDVLFYKLGLLFRPICEEVYRKCMIEKEIGKKNYTQNELEEYMAEKSASIESALKSYNEYMEEFRRKLEEDAALWRKTENNDINDPIKAFAQKMHKRELEECCKKNEKREGDGNAQKTR